jgi:hypothetical protein
MLDGAFDLTHFNIVSNLSLKCKFYYFIFDLTLTIILIFLFQNNLSIENILAFGTHHTHLAYQMMRDVFKLTCLRFADYLRAVVFFLKLHFFFSADHRLDRELFGVFYLKVLVAAFGDVEFAVEVIDIMLIDVG